MNAPEPKRARTPVTRTYKHRGILGCVEQWTARDTKTLVSLYHAEQGGFPVEPGGPLWLVVCEEHGASVGTNTRAQGRTTRSPQSFCEACRAEHGSSTARWPMGSESKP